MSDERKYLADGREVKVLGYMSDGHFVCQSVMECDGREVDGEIILRLGADVFDRVPMPHYEPMVRMRKQELASLDADIKTAYAQLQTAKKRLAEVLKATEVVQREVVGQ